MDTTLVLRHQYVILFALLLCLDLLTQCIKVVLLDFLAHLFRLFLLVDNCADSLGNLIRIEGITLFTEDLFLLLLLHLHFKRLRCLIFIPHILLSSFLHILEFFGFSLSHLLEHQFFVALGSLFVIALALVVAECFILGIVLDLIVLQFDEVLGPALLVLL